MLVSPVGVVITLLRTTGETPSRKSFTLRVPCLNREYSGLKVLSRRCVRNSAP